MSGIARPEEALSALKQFWIVLVPPYAGAGAERFTELRFNPNRSGCELKRPR